MLVSVKGDENSHGEGKLLASNNPGKFYINGLLVVMQGSLAEADLLSHPQGSTNAATGSSKFFICGLPVHRHGDLRDCGASTIVTGQSKFTSG